MEQTYFAKINKAATAECRNRRKIRLMITILAVAGGLFEMGEFGVRNWGVVDGEIAKKPEFQGYFGLFLIFVMAFFGAFAVFGIFSDLTNKQTADVQLSLPMSAKDRFLSKVLALARLHLIPLAIESVLMLVVGAIRGSEVLEDSLIYLLQAHGVIMACAVFVDAVCIFCMCCCGAKAEGVYTSAITGLCLSLTPFMFVNYIMETFSGVSYSRDNVGKICSVFGGMVVMCFPEADVFSTTKAFLVIAVNIVMSCLLAYASFYIYRKRDGRHVGKPMVYDLFMELFMFLGLFTLFTMFAYIQSWGIGLTVAAIIYLVIRIVAARAKITPKVFGVWILKYIVSFAVFVVIMAAGYFTGGFGYYRTRCQDFDCYYYNIDIETTGYENGYYDSSDFHDHSNRYTMKDKYEQRLLMSHSTIEEPENFITVEERRAKTKACMELVDKYYTLEGRDMKTFAEILFDGRDSYISNKDNRVYAHVNIYSSEDYSYNEYPKNDRYYSDTNYSVTFWIPASEREEFDREADEITGGSEDAFDWSIFDD